MPAKCPPCADFATPLRDGLVSATALAVAKQSIATMVIARSISSSPVE
jgi:hypothetical protein